MVAVIVESETDGLDDANCKTRCVAQECPYYWEGSSCERGHAFETFATSTFVLSTEGRIVDGSGAILRKQHT